ncbi:MAG: 4-hydroxythreonine-4-phosphate dehydrogenase PdxA [Bacteroidales bacterium]|nr:4-hydroxythreonine-4-phosphate dehydrogenase PdxA [Bacteroidales bacterium]MCF8403200.1 4-hydroxythreonine-4-phosphate dehydrogenase PdxA [Bacteroidales bacterium]
MNPLDNTSNTIKVGITHGDFNGISYEIIIKTLMDKRTLELYTPIVYGSSKIASYYRKTLDLQDTSLNLIKKADYANPKRANIINCFNDEVKIEIGKITKAAGDVAIIALEKAVEDLKWGKIDVLVTAPISKQNIQSDNFNFKGHTDYLASKFDEDDHLMIMVSDELRIGILTGHIPLSEVADTITTDLILSKIRVLNKSLKMDFNIRKPKIAVLGLNPHAGDSGLIGTKEAEVIIPAIQKANDDNILAIGPYPADGFFGSLNYKNFDAILAMYHDQGMLPFKTFSFDTGVNYTAGLPVIRTSPAHGTAFDIAGKNVASPNSLRQAIYLAMDIHRNRNEYLELNKNPLVEEVAEPQNANKSRPYPKPGIPEKKQFREQKNDNPEEVKEIPEENSVSGENPETLEDNKE